MGDTLSNLLFTELSSWDALNQGAHLADGEQAFPAEVRGLTGSLPAFFVARFLGRLNTAQIHARQYGQKQALGTDVLVVVPTAEDALMLQSDLLTITGASGRAADVRIFPQFSDIPYRAAAPGSIAFGQRAGVLASLARSTGQGQRVVIATERAFLQPLVPPEHVRSRCFAIRKGEPIDPQQVAQKLAAIGYARVPKVSARGEFALRGEVLDVFLGGQEYPHRIVFGFDTVEQIRSFDPGTQLTVAPHTELLVHPQKELVWDDALIERLERLLLEEDEHGIKNDFARYDAARRENGASFGYTSEPGPVPEETTGLDKDTPAHLALTDLAREQAATMVTELSVRGQSDGEELFYGQLWDRTYTLLDYLPQNAVVFMADYDRLSNAVRLLENEHGFSYRKARQSRAVLSPSRMLLSLDQLCGQAKHLVCLRSMESSQPVAGAQTVITARAEPAVSYFSNINYLKEQLSALQAEGWSIFVYAGNETQSVRIKEILKDFTEPDDKQAVPVRVVPLSLSHGFSVADKKIMVIQNDEIFRRGRERVQAKRKVASKSIESFIELSPGDFVVHKNYGIGKFLGIERVKSGGTERDYIKLEYAGQEFAFVPIEQVNLVQRYIGAKDGQPPRLDTIGSKSWSARKAKVQQQVEEMAERLVDLYSKRKASRGFAFPPDTEWQAAFEAAFPYEDTPDQLTVTQEIRADMEKPVPMDRLVCGDVGYGKTEIAMRAAFKAVMGGKQVAFLAPTTILAEQHYENCLERFRNFPVRISHLSRLVPPAEQKKTLALLKEGGIDIIVGTHRIIQKDVAFRDLGLLIIDEEQRFGVKDKEKLKELKTNIDCLAMSATPIPRTLHMSLLKIRDMSMLTTPPQNRHPIETFVEEFSEEKIADAIRTEVDRGGQVFFLHNRVETLEETRLRLQRLVPEMLIDTAHGKMSGDELDDIFRRFKMGGFHVLVSTTIIENGIDIPNVNTIIIDRADMYGVSQLYQLRGRVGRSDRTAFAYLFYPKDTSLNEDAMKRLQVISDFTELGSGFKIAMKDLEIRGAGNLLGKDQSGDVSSVGFEMYIHLMNMAIERLTQSDWHAPDEVLLELEYTGFIPDSYIASPQIKMEVYKRIAAVQEEDELHSLDAELADRFGPEPAEVASLLCIASIRILCNRLSISAIREKRGEMVVTFSQVARVNVDKVLRLIRSSAGTVRLDPAHPDRLLMTTGTIALADKSQFLKERLEMLT